MIISSRFLSEIYLQKPVNPPYYFYCLVLHSNTGQTGFPAVVHCSENPYGSGNHSTVYPWHGFPYNLPKDIWNDKSTITGDEQYWHAHTIKQSVNSPEFVMLFQILCCRRCPTAEPGNKTGFPAGWNGSVHGHLRTVPEKTATAPCARGAEGAAGRSRGGIFPVMAGPIPVKIQLQKKPCFLYCF